MDALNLKAATQTKDSLFDGRVPIMVGAIGHRKFSAEDKIEEAERKNRWDKIEEAARKKCRELKKEYPKSAFVVLPPIAEGADRLLTRVAMKELDAKLFAVLPFPPEEYEKDFKSSASKVEFQELLGKAAAHVHAFDGDGSALINVQGEPRNEQYARAGGIIIEQAQILFAVWDGQPARGTGGTGEQIEWFRQGSAPKRYSRIQSDISPVDPAEPGLLIRIDSNSGAIIPMSGAESITLGLSAEEKDQAGESLKGATKSDIFDILKRTERFNGNVLSRQSVIAGSLAKSPLTKAMPSFLLDAAATYNVADAMAISFGRRIRDADIALYSAAVLAVFFFNTLNNWPIASWAYFAIVVLIVGASIFLRKLAFEIRFLEYRGLAEALRVLFFWRIADIRRQVWLGYLSKHSGVLQWVRHAVRSIEFCESYYFPNAPELSGLNLIDKHWLDDQIEYYTSAGQKHLRHFRRWDTVSKISLGLSTIFSIAFLVISYLRWGGFRHWKDAAFDFGVLTASTYDITDALQVCLGLSLACGLAAKAFVIRRADFELSKQYLSARQMFILAKLSIQKSLKQTASGEEPDWTPPSIIERLGREALVEHAEWLWLRHSRPFEMPN